VARRDLQTFGDLTEKGDQNGPRILAGKAKMAKNAVGTFVGTLLQNGGYFWVVPTLRLVASVAVTT
jgi:hypothetical protein